jgi:hypothetical protein
MSQASTVLLFHWVRLARCLGSLSSRISASLLTLSRRPESTIKRGERLLFMWLLGLHGVLLDKWRARTHCSFTNIYTIHPSVA